VFRRCHPAPHRPTQPKHHRIPHATLLPCLASLRRASPHFVIVLVPLASMPRKPRQAKQPAKPRNTRACPSDSPTTSMSAPADSPQKPRQPSSAAASKPSADLVVALSDSEHEIDATAQPSAPDASPALSDARRPAKRKRADRVVQDDEDLEEAAAPDRGGSSAEAPAPTAGRRAADKRQRSLTYASARSRYVDTEAEEVHVGDSDASDSDDFFDETEKQFTRLIEGIVDVSDEVTSFIRVRGGCARVQLLAALPPFSLPHMHRRTSSLRPCATVPSPSQRR